MAAAALTLMTGAAGFVGRHVLRELVEQNGRVRLVVRDGRPNEIQRCDAIDTVVTTPDMWAETPAWWEKICHGVDTVIHLAWYAEPGKYLQSPVNSDCLAGTLRLAQGASGAKVRRFVGIGTCFEYDLAFGRLGIDTPLRPMTPYAEAKAAAFRALSQSLPQRGVEFVWCRLFYLYGEGEAQGRLVPYLRARLRAGERADLSSGTQVRDYLDVRDAARMIVRAARGTVQGPLNICSGTATTVRELAERIADEFGRRDLLQFGARPDNLTDPPVVIGVRAANEVGEAQFTPMLPRSA
jgi:dTDP-6-deoxy-L-talose 4-dehydrogenase (NAD+)